MHLLHYSALDEFRRQFYKDLLTAQHVVGGQIRIDKMSFVDGQEDNANFWGYVFEKDGVKYLLSAKDKKGEERNLREILPIRASKLLKVAYQGKVYQWIQAPVSVRITPKQEMSFKELLDVFTSIKHGNSEHQLLWWFMCLSQVLDRANYRLCTPAGFGKDSVVEILGHLLGNCSTIENPTLAKLEYETVKKLLAVNEVVGVSPEAWRLMEQFLLAAGGGKPSITKHSRASLGIGETLDISKFSLSLMYNDIDHYPDTDKYFDFVTKGSVKDRFIPLRLHGRYAENFALGSTDNVVQFVQAHHNDYLRIIRSLYYYQDNLLTLQKPFSYAKLDSMPERWQQNAHTLLRIINLYVNDQAEFDKWIMVINKCVTDYKVMLRYPDTILALWQKMQPTMPPKEFEEYKHRILDTLQKVPTFIEKLAFIESEIRQPRQSKDTVLSVY